MLGHLGLCPYYSGWASGGDWAVKKIVNRFFCCSFLSLKNLVVHLLKFNPNYTHIHPIMILFTNALNRSYTIELGGDAEGMK